MRRMKLMKRSTFQYWYWSPGARQACDCARTLADARKASIACRIGGTPHAHFIYKVRQAAYVKKPV